MILGLANLASFFGVDKLAVIFLGSLSQSCCDGLQIQNQFYYLVQNCKVQSSQF